MADGRRLFVGGIMEHVERAGVHSGDANNVVPCVRLKNEVQEKILEFSEKIALALQTVGSINIQYVVQDDVIFVPRGEPARSRTMPFLSKATGVPLVKLATKVIMGKTLEGAWRERNAEDGPLLRSREWCSRSSSFPGSDTVLGPEMKSTGESMGSD